MEQLGRYVLGSMLGSGGAGRVYRAVLQGPGGFQRDVALKVLNGSRGGLKREARLGGLLRHRNLVDVYEVGEEDGQWFAAMELCSGGALSKHLPLPPRAVVEVGRQVCAALGYAHEELGLVHLDLKPDNLLLDDHGVVKVADLGIARAEGFEGDGRIRGTPAYMPPEQWAGVPVDPRTDVYALGVTLVELATGWRPRPSATLDLDDLEADPNLDPVLSAPDWLKPAVERCLAHDPADRWPDMASLDRALATLDADGAGLVEALGLEVPEPVRRGRTNLPVGDGAFVGRRSELGAVLEALVVPGLVTLKGPAGIGKSRLAVEAGRLLQGDLGGEAWFCDLAPVRTRAGLVAAVAGVLGVRLKGAEDGVALLGRVLSAQSDLVLVLDNFEQIVEHAEVLARWLERAPGLRLVATSRVPLGLVEEQVVEVAPLDPQDAVALLVDRAAQRGVSLEAGPELEELAVDLDGLPLALELAAGRLGVLTVADVRERLGAGILRSGDGGRHQTLQAALEGSWSLLSEAEQAALVALSVFSGGCSLEAAEAVVGAAGMASVEALLRHSMVRADEDRLDLLVSVRAFATTHGDPSEALVRHGRWFARFGTDAAVTTLTRHGGVARRKALARDLDNLLVACRRAVDRGDGPIAVGTLRAAWSVLSVTGPYLPVLELAEAVLELPIEGDLWVQATLVRGESLVRSGRAAEAVEPLGRAVDALGPEPSVRRGYTVHSLGYALQNTGAYDEADRCYRESLEVFEAIGDRGGQGVGYGSVGIILVMRGLLTEARPWIERARDRAREVGDRNLLGASEGNLGIVARGLGERELAAEHYAVGLRLRREVGDRAGEGRVLCSLAVLWQHAGDEQRAREGYQRAVELCRTAGDQTGAAIALGNYASMLHDSDPDEAERLYREAIATHREVGDGRIAGVMTGNLGGLLEDRGERARAEASYREAAELAQGVGDIRHEGFWLTEVARLADSDEAEALLDRAWPLLEASGASDMLAAYHGVRGGRALDRGDLEAAQEALAAIDALGALDNPEMTEPADALRERLRALES